MPFSTPTTLRAFYDDEAGRYDETRGGSARAAQAALGFAELLGPPAELPGPVLEVGTGTAIVATALSDLGYPMAGVDLSFGMLRHGSTRHPARLPGRLVQADGASLPLADGRCGAVVLSWVLHLVADPAPVVAEAARVLAPGGLLVSTVDKTAASRAAGGPTGPDRPVTDAPALLDELTAAAGLSLAGAAQYVAHGQAGQPTYRLRSWAAPGPGRGPR